MTKKMNKFLRHWIIGGRIFSWFNIGPNSFTNMYSSCRRPSRFSSLWFRFGLWSACKITRIQFQRIFFELHFWGSCSLLFKRRRERESLNVRVRHGDDDETNKAQIWATVWSIMCARNCATDEDNTNNEEETLQTNDHRALTSLQLLFSWVYTCFRVAATLNMLLCLSLCIRVITALVINVPTHSLFTCMWIPCRFCRFSHCENGSFEVLSSHDLCGKHGGEFGWSGTSVKWQRRCPKVNRNLTWTKRGKACMILIFSTNTNSEDWSIDSLGLRNVQQEVSEKLPQGYPRCWCTCVFLFDQFPTRPTR